jgi:hypothetical protein
MHVRPIHWAKGVKYYVATIILFIMSTVLRDFMNEEKNYLVHLMRNSRVSKILDSDTSLDDTILNDKDLAIDHEFVFTIIE